MTENLTKEELLDTLKRVQAEFENYKKRVDKERQELHCLVKISTIKQLINIYEDIQKCAENGNDGMKLAFANFQKYMQQQGLQEIKCQGNPDPFLHEVIMKMQSNAPEGTIIKELQKGYLCDNKVVRYAKVAIAEKENGGDEKCQK